MVVPAEQHAVVRVGRAPSGVLGYVVDLAPARGDAAAGDHTSAVTERDRATLVPVEDALFRADRDDPSVGTCGNPLNHATTRDVAGDADAHGLLIALQMRVPAAGDEVLGVDGYDERRRVPADRRQKTGGCRDGERRSEGIVLLLRPGALIAGIRGRAVTAGSIRARVVEHDGGGEVGVEDRLQLRRHLRQQRAPHCPRRALQPRRGPAVVPGQCLEQFADITASEVRGHPLIADRILRPPQDLAGRLDEESLDETLDASDRAELLRELAH